MIINYYRANMAGKSACLGRQHLICPWMAQMGLFRAGSFARIGIIDKVSLEVGAIQNNFVQRESTFLWLNDRNSEYSK